jgi:hypothetical protein
MKKTTKTATTTYRQGDVLIRRIDALPNAELKPIALDAGRVVLAYGEVTGHAHAIVSPDVLFLINEQTLNRYLDVKQPVTLKHEEHFPIQLPAGQYEVVQQREYTPQGLRDVVD